MRVYVIDGKVRRVESVDGVNDSLISSGRHGAKTVPEMLMDIRKWLSQVPHSHVVRLHSRYEYPEEVDINFNAREVHEEVNYRIVSFRFLKKIDAKDSVISK